MNLGAHIYLWIERWSDREVGLCHRARALGLNTLELSVGLDVPFDAALTRRAANDAGISLVLGPGGAWPENADLVADDHTHRQAAYDFHRGIIDQTAAVGGVAYAGALYGRPGKSLRRPATRRRIGPRGGGSAWAGRARGGGGDYSRD
jgi:sugar phosphate isomerase/epimerase